MQPKVIDINSKEQYALELAISTLRFKFENKYKFSVETIYFDYGQDWWWTTIVCQDPERGSSYQLLNPRDWELIVTATTAQEIVEVVDKIEIVYDKYGKN